MITRPDLTIRCSSYSAAALSGTQRFHSFRRVDKHLNLTRGGEPITWCWETGQYERASEAAAVGEAARAARLAREQAAKDAAAWEAKKAAMSKRERKKADLERERAQMAQAGLEGRLIRGQQRR